MFTDNRVAHLPPKNGGPGHFVRTWFHAKGVEALDNHTTVGPRLRKDLHRHEVGVFGTVPDRWANQVLGESASAARQNEDSAAGVLRTPLGQALLPLQGTCLLRQTMPEVHQFPRTRTRASTRGHQIGTGIGTKYYRGSKRFTYYSTADEI